MSLRIEGGRLGQASKSVNNNRRINPNLNFQEILNDSIGKKKQDIKISAHAQERMLQRNIRLQKQDMQLMEKAMDNLQGKGAKESLMIYKDMAFIASVDNRTIITALDSKEIDIVTNIDSAIIVK